MSIQAVSPISNVPGGFPESTTAVTPCGQSPPTELSILTVCPVSGEPEGGIIAAPGGEACGEFCPGLSRHIIVPTGKLLPEASVSVTSNTVVGSTLLHSRSTGGVGGVTPPSPCCLHALAPFNTAIQLEASWSAEFLTPC